MGKDSRARVLADHQAMAIGRNIRVSPRKLNLVAQQIRGKRVDRALNELTFSPKRLLNLLTPPPPDPAPLVAGALVRIQRAEQGETLADAAEAAHPDHPDKL
ncbi:MAG: uL22 family ribosomal protein, partial [Pseudomonadota bacterium]